MVPPSCVLPESSARTPWKALVPREDCVILYDLFSLTSSCFSKAEREVLLTSQLCFLPLPLAQVRHTGGVQQLPLEGISPV